MASSIPGISDNLKFTNSGAGGVANLTAFLVFILAAFMYLISIHGYVYISLNPQRYAKYSFNLLSNRILKKRYFYEENTPNTFAPFVPIIYKL